MEALDWLRKTHQSHVIDRGPYVHFSCHACGEKAGRSAFLVVDSERVRCYQPSCWLSYQPISFKKYVAFVEGGSRPEVHVDKSRAQPKRRNEAERDAITLPDGFQPVTSGDGPFSRRARRYLKGRNLDPEEMWERWKMGVTMEPGRWFGRLLIPFHLHGQLVWWQGRDYTGIYSRWDNPPGVDKKDMLFGRESIGGDRDLWLFEGLFNVLTMGNDPACAMLGKELHDPQAAALSLHTGRVLVACDEGAWVDSLMAAHKLASCGVDAWAVPVTRGDANEAGREHTLSQADNAARVTVDTLPDLLARSFKEGNKTYPGKGGKVVTWW